MVDWSDNLSISNVVMDSDHKNLVAMVNTVEHAIRSGDCTILSQAFQRLFMCVEIHFSNEERFAKALELPFDQHKKLHFSQHNELGHMRTELEAKSGIWSEGAVEHFSQALRNWLLDHIHGDVIALKGALSNQPYHFKP